MATVARFVGLLAFGSLTSLAACTQGAGTAGEAPPPASAPVATDAPAAAPGTSLTKGAVIGKIVTHDAKVSIVGGGRELRVVVQRHDGALVADGITLAELRAREPELYFVVTSAVAGAEAPTGASPTYVDATLHIPTLN